VQRIEAVEHEFPEQVPACCVAVLSVRFMAAGWVVNLHVRPGTDVAVKKLAEEWAGTELVHLALYPEGTIGWEENVLNDGVLIMQKYGLVEPLPEV
jgi:hypothetical protein